MAVLTEMRVRLKEDLTRYNPAWTAGAMGTTVPNAKFSQWGWQDRFAGVRFDGGSVGDILLGGLEIIKDEPKPRSRRAKKAVLHP
jgi:hypothetical protein